MRAELPVLPFDQLDLSPRLRRDLRSDQAGEAGAVAIYRGMLAVSRDPIVRAFAEEHLETERRHLAFFDAWLPARQRSRLLGLWRLSGYLLGVIAAVLGRHWVFVTIEAVETFVVRHYEDQLIQLRGNEPLAPLAARLAEFQADEDHHRSDAGGRRGSAGGLRERLWAAIIDGGSQVAVVFARAI